MTNITPMDDAGIQAAAHCLKSGGLVAFPTETVYGLGGNACDDHAVARIYEAKGRPDFNPLIVHVPDLMTIRRYAKLPNAALYLAERFWPGALTLVLKRKDQSGLSKLVSAGLDTVAIRIPSHPDARKLLAKANLPVAAPSANASGRLSPTTAQHVKESLDGRIDMILDGGVCQVGVESTIIDMSVDQPVLLRPGGVAASAIEECLGTPLRHAESNDHNPKSPGMLTSHYAPSKPIRLNAQHAETGELFLGFGAVGNGDLNLSSRGDLREAAANLFRFLHQLDAQDGRGIAVAPIPDIGLGLAINDRLARAAAPRS